MDEDKVSIITPSMNSEKFIAEMINSVLRQSYLNWELIIVDDCSNDNTIKIITEFSDERIKLVKLNRNVGPAICRNVAIRKAKGRFIAFLDSDDLWDKEKLKRQIEFMKKNECVFSFTEYEKITENGKKTGNIVRIPEKLDYVEELKYNQVGCLTAIYDKAQLGKLYMPNLKKRQDYGLWLKILKKGYIGYGLRETLAYYRVRKNSISRKKIYLVRWNWRLYRDFEKISFGRSLYYIFTNILNKLLKKESK